MGVIRLCCSETTQKPVESYNGQRLYSLIPGAGWSTHSERAIRTIKIIQLVEGNMKRGRPDAVAGVRESESETLCWIEGKAVSEPPAEVEGVSESPWGVVMRMRPSSLQSWVGCSSGGGVRGRGTLQAPA